ncbi:FAD-binding protein [Microbacterium horticulturae]|uniref:FAD-binding protein n=1 Tax=Microbacterium horticulturae TaxID=3028316 RepID=A0ABY8C2T4_9MICO|nr:FAD-binding protein [Microbacterium sp. KACC 23027]WEG09540.1 FAD-binding protein [Microbacterium sp. KACC 23027]
MHEQTNWAGNHHYRATRFAEPQSVDELAALITDSPAVRVIGSRHSFNDIADSDDLLISTTGLPTSVEIDAEARTVTVGGGVRYGDLALALQQAGWALHNLASLPHISVAGAVATATHGSGDRNGNLATAVRGIHFLSGTGEAVELRRGDPGFEGAVVAIGALGVVVALTLDIVPTFAVRQRLFSGLGWDAATARFDEIFASAYSVSLFTLWDEPTVSLAWIKERVDEPSRVGEDFFGAIAEAEVRHMIAGMDVRNVTEQVGVAGPWSERLAHFRYEFTPSTGAEIQSEYLVPRARAVEAIEAVRALGPRLRGLLQISEIRSVAADRLWLSTAYETEMIGLHFTWVRDSEGVAAVLPAIEEVLYPLGARPHWGKVFAGLDAPAMYPRLGDFRALADRHDPESRFRNAFVRRVLA